MSLINTMMNLTQGRKTKREILFIYLCTKEDEVTASHNLAPAL